MGEYSHLVVHCKHKDYDVYVGRGSKWGNPFTHKQGTKAKWVVGSVEEAVQKYAEWLYNQDDLLADIHELKGKILGCWCAGPTGLEWKPPFKCHGQILAILANDIDIEE